METTDKARESRLRRQATRLGLMIRKSRTRNTSLDDYGLYYIIDPYSNFVVFAPRANATLDDIEEYLTEVENGTPVMASIT